MTDETRAKVRKYTELLVGWAESYCPGHLAALADAFVSREDVSPMQIKPITPAEALEGPVFELPEFVYRAVNQLLRKHARRPDSLARFTMGELCSAMEAVDCEYQGKFTPNWVSALEAAYERVGWEVEYDRPGFNEAYEAHFTFRRA